MLVDIHSHLKNGKNFNHICFNVEKNSLGIHPYELLNSIELLSVEEKIIKLKAKISPFILAVGECGLDRRKVGIFSIEDQITVLKWHLDWAIEIKKPIIIHCVRAHSDLLKILKSKRYKGKILLHDFSGNFREAQAFLAYDSYFSFGHRLYHKTSQAAEVFKSLPREKVFLETDDQTEFTIQSLYQMAQTLFKIDQIKLELLFENNLKCFFSDLDNISPADVINYLRVT